MNTNILFLSPRSIKSDYIPALFETLHVSQIVSFLSPKTIPDYLSVEIMKYPCTIQDDTLPEFSMCDAIRKLSLSIIDRIKEGGVQADTRKGIISNGCVLVLADWQPVYYGQYEQYYSWISRQNLTFGRWTSEHTCYPFNSKQGNLPDLLVADLHNLLEEYEETELWEHVTVLQTSVFFTSLESTSLTYNPDEHNWTEHVYHSRKNPDKTKTLVRYIMLSVAKSDQNRFVYTNEKGVRIMTRPIVDEAYSNLKLWKKAHEKYLRRVWENEVRQEWNDCNDNNDSDVEKGCGNGWTCDNCPNFGCPANEMN